MENHGLGTHNDKMCAEILTGNTPQLIQPICPNRPIISDIFEKKSTSHVHWLYSTPSFSSLLVDAAQKTQVSFLTHMFS